MLRLLRPWIATRQVLPGVVPTVSSHEENEVRRIAAPHNQLCTCLRCGNLWKSKVEEPKRCAKCRTPFWNTPRRVAA